MIALIFRCIFTAIISAAFATIFIIATSNSWFGLPAAIIGAFIGAELSGILFPDRRRG
jgi:enoyl-CoA hydratase/carnithine racemase